MFAVEADVVHPGCPDCCPGSSTVRDSGLLFSVDADIPHGEAGDEAKQLPARAGVRVPSLRLRPPLGLAWLIASGSSLAASRIRD